MENDHYINNLTINTAGMPYYKTEFIIDNYLDILDEKTKQQIRNLGVHGRHFARPMGSVPPFNDRETHREHLLEVGKQCMLSTSLDIDNLIVASEIADYQTPGLAPTLLNPLRISKFAPAFNLQGTACSSMPRCIELARKLPGNTLCIIDGITSDIYQSELMKTPKDYEQKSEEWVKIMFGFLFGDATAAFIVSEDTSGKTYKIGRQAHVMNLDLHDYRSAAVRRNDGRFSLSANANVLNNALAYTDVVLTKLGIEEFGQYERIILHTGSQKIINGYLDKYSLTFPQIEGSKSVLSEYGNTTGCSLPLVLNQKEFIGEGLMIGITMGFGVDIVEIKGI